VLEWYNIIVEQKVREVLKIADRVYVLRNGRVSFTGPATDDRQRWPWVL
jgi:ABC-type branched-subunit amino acid transport system ATPase component